MQFAIYLFFLSKSASVVLSACPPEAKLGLKTVENRAVGRPLSMD